MLLNKEEDIKKWLDDHLIEKYKIIKNKKYGYVVNVNDNVNLKSKKLNYVIMDFIWSDCRRYCKSDTSR